MTWQSVLIPQLEAARDEFLETAQKHLDGYAVDIGELRRLIGEEGEEESEQG